MEIHGPNAKLTFGGKTVDVSSWCGAMNVKKPTPIAGIPAVVECRFGAVDVQINMLVWNALFPPFPILTCCEISRDLDRWRQQLAEDDPFGVFAWSGTLWKWVRIGDTLPAS